MPPNSSGPPLLKTSMRRAVAAPAPSPHLLSVQRSEFEDFMNAYRPTLESPPPRTAPEETTRSDFGRSIKRLMKGGSPSAPRMRAPERQKAKRPAPLSAPTSQTQEPAPPAPPPPKKSSVATGGQPPPKSPVKKASLPPPPKVSSPQVKPLPPPREEVAPPPEGREKRRSGVDQEAQQHCLLVTGTSIGRFLPPRHNPDPILSMRVVSVPERKYHVILEFEEALPPPRPLTSSSGMIVAPLEEEDTRTRDTRDQMAFFHWLRESHVAPMGMLLMNVERTAEFPFVTYLVVGGGRQELAQKLKFVGERPVPDRQDQLRFIAGYEEPVTICSPPASFPERPLSDRAGFVICLYQVLSGEDGLRLDQNWVTWTGARQIYRTLPAHMGLRRISVHKSLLPTRTVNYVLVCEFSHLMDHLTDACVIIDHLRARCCGFVGIYRVIDAL